MDNIREIVNWTGNPLPEWLARVGTVVDGGAVVACVQDQKPDPETTYIIDTGLGVAPKLPPKKDGVVHVLGRDVAQFISLVELRDLEEPRGDLYYV